MYVSEQMTDDQPLMRCFSHDKFLRLLDPQPAIDAWKVLDRPSKDTAIWKPPTSREYPEEFYGSRQRSSTCRP